MTLKGFCDVNLASASDDEWSTSGFYVFLANFALLAIKEISYHLSLKYIGLIQTLGSFGGWNHLDILIAYWIKFSFIQTTSCSVWQPQHCVTFSQSPSTCKDRTLNLIFILFERRSFMVNLLSRTFHPLVRSRTYSPRLHQVPDSLIYAANLEFSPYPLWVYVEFC